MTSKTVSWKLSNGKKATVTVSVGTYTIHADGDAVEVADKTVRIKATVEGLGQVGYTEPQKTAGKAAAYAPYALGKLGLTEEQYRMVMDAIAAVRAESGLDAIRAKADEVDATYEAHTEMMRRVMAE